MAALCSTVEIFDELIAHGARLEDSRALHHAAACAHGLLGHNDTRIMERLLELGVDINGPGYKGNIPPNGSFGPPIFWAIRMGKIANIKFLVENGADLTVKGPYIGRTPLEQARAQGYTEIAEYLQSVSPKGV